MPKILRQQRMARSASRIQAYWRLNFKYNKTRNIIARLLAHGMTTRVALAMNFETLVTTLREQAIISNFKAALRRIHLLTTFRHGSPSSALVPENVNVRVVLAAFMIAYRPTHVFETTGPLEQALVDSATPLIETFERICTQIHKNRAFSDVPAELTRNFPTLLLDYLRKFKAWKVPDEAKLTRRIKHALAALYQAKERLSPNEPVDSKLRMELDTQTRNLRLKLSQIAGDSALQEFDDRYEAGETPTQQPSIYATMPGRISNQQLVHELLLDPAFQLNDDGGCAIENATFDQIRLSFQRAFWDSLADDMRLQPTPCFARVLRVCGEIGDSLKELVSEQRSSIEEILDLDFIKQQAEAGLYGLESCRMLVSGIISIIRSSQLPERHESLDAQWPPLLANLNASNASEESFCAALEFILERVHLMRVDHSNARLRLISPMIRTHGVTYERDHFESQLNDGTMTLTNTTAWIDKSLRETVKARPATLDGIINGRAADYTNAHANALFSTLIDTLPIALHTLPETLLFDTHHLQRMQKEIKYITNATAVVMTVASSAPPLVIKNFVDLLLSGDTIVDLEAAETTFRMDEALVRIEDDATRARIRQALFRCIQPSDAVNQLMQLRVRKLLRSMMTTSAEATAPPALRSLMPRFQRTMSKINHLAAINRAVHASTYERLFKEAALKIKEERK